MLHAVDKDGNGLIGYAADAGDVNVMEYLIRKGLDPLRPHAETGLSPLHVAVAHHRLELARFLLSCGASPHAPDAKGQTVLQLHALQQDPVLKAALYSHRGVSKCGLSCLSTKNDVFPSFDAEKGITVMM
jgi:ankyrin repeat protein